MRFAPAPARPGLPSGSGLGRGDPSRPASTDRDDARRDTGQALVEPLVALALVGLVVAPLVAGAHTVVVGSGRLNALAAAHLVAHDAAERLVAADLAGCADDRHAEVVAEAAAAVGWPSSAVTLLGSAHAEPADDGWWTWVDDVVPCDPRTAVAPRRMDIRVDHPAGGASVLTSAVVAPRPIDTATTTSTTLAAADL